MHIVEADLAPRAYMTRPVFVPNFMAALKALLTVHFLVL